MTKLSEIKMYIAFLIAWILGSKRRKNR